MVAATIGPCSGSILLTFGDSCPCHLETKANGLTSLKISALGPSCRLSLPCKNPTTMCLHTQQEIDCRSVVCGLFVSCWLRLISPLRDWVLSLSSIVFFFLLKIEILRVGCSTTPAAGADGSRQKEATLPCLQANTPSSFSSFTPVRKSKDGGERQKLTYNQIGSSADLQVFLFFSMQRTFMYGPCKNATFFNVYLNMQLSYNYVRIWNTAQEKKVPTILFSKC